MELGHPWVQVNNIYRGFTSMTFVEIFVKAIEDEKMNGAYNAVANWATNAEMTKAIAKILNRPLWLPKVPPLALKIILGEMADIVLNGKKVSSEKIKQAGFRFQYSVFGRCIERPSCLIASDLISPITLSKLIPQFVNQPCRNRDTTILWKGTIPSINKPDSLVLEFRNHDQGAKSLSQAD